jgi:Outer membrane protein beta-barrel domain
MKKYFFILLLTIICSISFAQDLKFKPTIGINTNIQNAPLTYNNKSKICFDIGILTERDLKHNLSFEFGFLVSKSNFSLNREIQIWGSQFPITPFVANEKINLTFLKVPILLALKQHKKNPFAIGLGLLAKGVLKSNYIYNVSSQPHNTVKDNYEFGTNSELGVGLGLQTALKKEFTFSKKNFTAGLYYDYDITKWSHYKMAIDIPREKGYDTRAHNFSVLFSMTL